MKRKFKNGRKLSNIKVKTKIRFKKIKFKLSLMLSK